MARDKNGRRDKALYDLDHGKLNLSLPPPSMWMNMGFWKDTEDFPTACCALLKQVLAGAGILQEGRASESSATSKTLSIIDLGFGCGDQSLYIKNTLGPQGTSESDLLPTRSLKAYVGLTLDHDQCEIAQERLSREHPIPGVPVTLHRADAGKAGSWTSELSKEVMTACHMDDDKDDHQNWLLALDTLYHFQPSKWPVIDYACVQLGASLMAYDLCMADDLSFWQRLVLRLMAFLGHSPFVNWVTMDQYCDRLVQAGYERDKIEIRDISEHTFRPLARFLRRRDVELKRYGMSIGRFRHGAAMFDWWGKSGVVKGCIIIARK